MEKGFFYTMGSRSLQGTAWTGLKTFAPNESFEQLLRGVESVPIGANGLLYTPYLVGERTPHADSSIRGSLIGMDGAHKREHF